MSQDPYIMDGVIQLQKGHKQRETNFVLIKICVENLNMKIGL